MERQAAWSSRWRRAILAGAGAIVVTAIVLVVATTTHEGRADATRAETNAAALRPSLTVTTAKAERSVLPAVIEASGAIAAWQEASISARVAGLALVSVDANVGDVIRKGQVLARFDDADVRAEVAKAEANLAQSEANAQQADSYRDRALAVGKSGALSEQSLLQSTTQAAMADAQVAQAKATLVAARLKLAYTAVTAPDNGVVSSRSAVLGVVAQAGTELFRFIRQGRLEWRAELNPAQVSAIKAGLAVNVHLPDGQSATGRVRQLAPTLSSDTRLVLAYVDLDHAASARPGMYASGTIQTAIRDITTVPGESIVIRDGRPYVLRLNGNEVQQLAVEVGVRQGRLAEIISGVAPGDLVVVRGAGFVNDHDIVRVENGT
ncbi:MAG: efflux RND transporter periplasmic adaptor subunit [Steroidobacteraceae bacterium]